MPAVNLAYASSWSEHDRNMFHRLPYFTSFIQAEVTKDVQVHAKLLGKRNWEPNKGTTLRTIVSERTPLDRQFLRPAPLHTSLPRVDTIQPSQRELTDTIFEQKYSSHYISWVPSFTDLQDSFKLYADDLSRKVALFPELVARTYIYHQARYMMFCGKQANSSTPTLSIIGRDVVLAPQGNGDEAVNDPNPTNGKTLGWLKSQILQMDGDRGLTLGNVHRAITALAQQGLSAYKGSNTIGAENKIPQDKYLLVLGEETSAQWVFDPLVQKLSGANADLLTGNYSTPMLNRIITKTEQYPIRYAIDPTTKDLSIPTPEIRVLTGENAGQTVPNPAYLEAPIEIAWLYSGVTFGNAIKVGPPPGAFTKEASGLFAKLTWNGELITYTPTMLEVVDPAGGVKYIENQDRRVMQMFSNVAGGVQGIEKRAAMPIAFYRNVGSGSFRP